MPILAIDTATLVSGVAIANEDKLMAELTLQTRLTHSEVLMPHIQQIMQMTKLEKNQLEAIAVSIGPGSFTGLRIGLATAKTMAYALNIPVIGVSTLAAQAYNCQTTAETLLLPLLDAQKGNVYTAQYRFIDNEFKEITEPSVRNFAELLEEIKDSGQEAMFLGEAAVKNRQAILEAGGKIRLANPHLIMPRAASVAMLGLKKLKIGEVSNVMDLEPFYIRRSEAEVLWEQRNGK